MKTHKDAPTYHMTRRPGWRRVRRGALVDIYSALHPGQRPIRLAARGQYHSHGVAVLRGQAGLLGERDIPVDVASRRVQCAQDPCHRRTEFRVGYLSYLQRDVELVERTSPTAGISANKSNLAPDIRTLHGGRVSQRHAGRWLST